MSVFSGALQLSDLDDFIKPSQECVKPEVIKSRSTTGAKISIASENGISPQNNDSEKYRKVEITLQDCLACSGCVTSAEGVLITQQSHEQLQKILAENNALKAEDDGSKARTIVFSISQQPVLSLAARYDLPVEEAARHLSGYLRELGADIILDTRVADDLALLEMREEFVKRYREQLKMPMLSSSCPGWICYAEKTHGNLVLPYISTTRSPQQIMGVLVKQMLAEERGLAAEKIYHIAIMPCFDKKLEALREVFYQEMLNSHDVDFVITSLEIEQMFQSKRETLNIYPTVNFDRPWQQHEEANNIVWGYESSTSGGFAEHIFKYAAKELFNVEKEELEFKQKRNQDFREISLEHNGKIVLSFAIVNGFRNIQNFIQKFKRGKCDYHFVEIMACPAGCINGGGQVRPQEGQHPRELTMSLQKLYRQLPQSQPLNETTQKLYEQCFESPGSEKAETLLHTTYQAVTKLDTSLNIKW